MSYLRSGASSSFLEIWFGVLLSCVGGHPIAVHCSLYSVLRPVSSVQCPVSCVQCPVSSVLCPVSSRDHCPWFTSVHHPALTGGPCPVSSVQPSVDCPCTLLCWWPSRVHCFSMGGSALSSRHPNTVCSVQCAVCSVQCAVCSVQCAVCSVLCAVCSMQWAVCSVNLKCPLLSVQCYQVGCSVPTVIVSAHSSGAGGAMSSCWAAVYSV